MPSVIFLVQITEWEAEWQHEYNSLCDRADKQGRKKLRHFFQVIIGQDCILAENTGKTVEQIAVDTERDHYMSAEEALRYGLIDSIIQKRMAG